MTDEPEGYTLWTRPSNTWTRVLDGVELTDEVRPLVEKAIEDLDETTIKERLKPYDTPVAQDTMSQFVK